MSLEIPIAVAFGCEDTDDIRLHSGVANVGKEIVLHSAHKYNWYNLGGAINHPELGKIFDISDVHFL